MFVAGDPVPFVVVAVVVVVVVDGCDVHGLANISLFSNALKLLLLHIVSKNQFLQPF